MLATIKRWVLAMLAFLKPKKLRVAPVPRPQEVARLTATARDAGLDGVGTRNVSAFSPASSGLRPHRAEQGTG